jgi:para-aminobenzoate synthetase/4-amino-4-deoxychorismate lyase
VAVSDGLRRARLRAEPGSERFLDFEEPVESWVAERPAEVPELLDRAERAAVAGGWVVGFVGYEAAPAFDPALVAHEPAGPAPLAAFSVFGPPREGALESPGRLREPALDATPAIGEPAHAAAVEAVREAIAAGAVYQVNLTFPFRGSFRGRPDDLLAGLLAPGEAPYAALLEGERWAVVSLSPELFFERAADRLTMRPMKGTRARGRYAEEDAQRAAELAASAKDRSENLMIVDLVRNDLGRIARPATVELARAFEIERYPTVWQMTSTVTARSDASLRAIFAALFPCASVTGAPKPAATRFVRDLEGAPRGVYCGAIGRLAPGGDARFSVAIRTLELDRSEGSFRYGVGSGVVWESSAGEEWRECLAKAKVLAGPPPEFELLETMRWRPGCGIALLDLHLERLEASARYFGFGPTGASLEGEARAAVEVRCAGLPPRSHRVRLRASRAGGVVVEVEPFAKDRRGWSVAVSSQSVREVFSFHKTTHRAAYDAATRTAPPGVDEVLLQNEAGYLTEGTRTNLVVDRGDGWVTPPREHGLLAGVFRESLLRAGRLREAPLTVDDLRRARRVALVNALRGWIPVAEVREVWKPER